MTEREKMLEALREQLEEFLSMPIKEDERLSFGEEDDPLTEKFLEEEAERKEGDSFRECLDALIEKKSIAKRSHVYKASGISKYTFSRIMSYRSEHKPSRETVAALTIGLRLDLEEAQTLYHAAGFHLGTSEFLDRVIRFFIREGRYDIEEVNYCLDYYNYPLLGEHGRED